MHNRALLISNSTVYGGGYLDHVEHEIRGFLGSARRVLFCPFALHDRDAYASAVRKRFGAMGYSIESAHETAAPQKAVEETDAIFIGGIDSALIAAAKVVADSLEQSCAIGDVHHAIAQSLMRKEYVYAELCEIVAGQKIGRFADDEIIVFDSTGVAIEDAVAAAAVYERALTNDVGTDFNFAD